MQTRTKPPIRTITGLSSGPRSALFFLESIIEPLVIVFVMWGLFLWFENRIPLAVFLTSILLFSITFPSGAKLRHDAWRMSRNVIFQWLVLAGLVLMLAEVTGVLRMFDPQLLWLWGVGTPLLQIAALLVLKKCSPAILEWQGPMKNAVVVGLNEQGLALANSLLNDTYNRANVLGFFEDRSAERAPADHGYAVLGKLADLAGFCKTHPIHTIYIALPMSSHPRILSLLDNLKDTTASIYFVPDIYVTDLIQGRVSDINGIPVVSVCESPFTGLDGALKRSADLLFSSLILLLISPLMLGIAIAVKLSSPGPIIFKQRRYGLDGQEILVYKFRSMTVTEDGNTVTQATKHDQRITPLGAFLRKTSLDELPQFINVLQGRMSVVGPRPHAVSHNEEYRKLIKGYMVRHKVKPGITGWAQVNGFRGETNTLDKMEQRVHYDLEYLRNWSPRLDMLIVAKTIWLTLVGQDSAY